MKRYFGLEGSAASWQLLELLEEGGSALIVAPDEVRADDLFSNLRTFGCPIPLLRFPSRTSLPYEPVTRDRETATHRNWCLSKLLSKQPAITIASATSLLQLFLPTSFYQTQTIRLQVAGSQTKDRLYEEILQLGYMSCNNVTHPGDVANRGGILDIYPGGTPGPIRIEFFQGGIQSIRLFDPLTQRSLTGELAAITIPAARDHLHWEEICSLLTTSDVDAERLFKLHASRYEIPPREAAEVLEAMRLNLQLPGLEIYQHIFPISWGSFLDITERTILIDQQDIEQAILDFDASMSEREARLLNQHRLIPPRSQLFLEGDALLRHLHVNASAIVNKLALEHETHRWKKVQTRSLSELRVQTVHSKGRVHPFEPLKKSLKSWRLKNFRVCFLIGSEHRAKRLQRILLELDFDIPILQELSPREWTQNVSRFPVCILLGELSEGFQLIDELLVFVSERDVFGEQSSPRGKPTTSVKKILDSLSQLKCGDLVVHVDYGIGRYQGFQQRTVNGGRMDLLEITYADSTLLLPMTSIAKVQRYSGVEGKLPNLDKLSSQRWQKTKAKVRESVEYLAGDLIKLYAARKVSKGWRYDPAGALDENFADGFPFQETPDQLQAIDETFADMARDRPMDRLICGDVGFGKTEIALRAAFKATQHGKQVAVLCPTTILADQHYETFKKRFSEYPVRVGAVSRFYKKEQNDLTMKGVESGEIDIIVGTHKLLGRTISFKDLGLLIIDEEHRFGVKQKERLKQLRAHIDVLTLTATPIPRTLHMSLLQLRDMSVITTPPTNRRTVRTFVTPTDETTVRDALLRELHRGGQAFYIHNRVKSIEGTLSQLRLLVPEARIEYAHGQMHESQLEKIMHKFLAHEIDVLVSTTIVESGIDISNANTIMIERADTFGLAQLYQLRGRVGRSKRQAYCYFLTPKKQRLSAEAQERLLALQSLDELGIGFQLAIRDLEIRGAGNLLGKEQSGSVLSVGFDLYIRILDEAIHYMTGEELALETLIEPEVVHSIHAFIPQEYIPDVQERMVMYQRLSSLSSETDGQLLLEEMEDRFGAISSEIRALTNLMIFRHQLKSFGVLRCEIQDNKFLCTLSEKAPVDTKKVLHAVQSNPRVFRLGKNNTLTINIENIGKEAQEQTYETVLSMLSTLLMAHGEQ